MMSKIRLILIIALLTGTITTSMAATDIVVSGSTIVGHLVSLCANAFNKINKDYNVSISEEIGGSAIADIASGNADIAMVFEEISADQKKMYGDKFNETPIAYDGICICVSKNIYDAGIANLTKDQVKAIYTGSITNWKQVGGPDKNIYVIGGTQGSGAWGDFNEDIMGKRNANTPGAKIFAASSSDIVTNITKSDRAIGYIVFSEIGDLKPVAINGVSPTKETIRKKTYLLSHNYYLDTFGEVKTGAKAFIDFVKGSQGQEIAQDNGFISL